MPDRSPLASRQLARSLTLSILTPQLRAERDAELNAILIDTWAKANRQSEMIERTIRDVFEE